MPPSLLFSIYLYHHPLTSSLDEFIHQKSDVVENKPDNVEAEELRRMSSGQL